MASAAVALPDHAEVARPSGLLRRTFRLLAAVAEWFFGAASLVIGLSVLATIPLVQLASLGYLLEVSGRVARTGRLRAGFVGIHKAARLGRIALGVTLLMIPLWIASTLYDSARLIDA